MEAAGDYWLCAHEVREQAGWEVLVVNGKHGKNLPGRKTDMQDCPLALSRICGLLVSA